MPEGWHDDALEQELPGETPGDPVPGGPWEIARRVIIDYRMADPAIVRADWAPDAPLLGRVIELQLRFRRLLWVRAHVRVRRVWDEERGGARVFGYAYETLPGHVETGVMDYEVYKRLEDGRVEFRVHARSRPSGQGPWWARFGFRLVGRREQVRFYFRCCSRLAELVSGELGLPASWPPPAARLREGDAPDVAGLGERLVPRRTR
jgi:uncharacterized protein (UPF0548 family)